MAETVHLVVDQWAKLRLPYGFVVVVQGEGLVTLDGGRSRLKLRNVAQAIGPFMYDRDFELAAYGASQYTLYNLNAITQSDLNGLTTLPRGTRAVVDGGSVWAPKYWNGANWVNFGGGGGGDVEEAPIDGTPYQRQDAGWVSPVQAMSQTTVADADNYALTGDSGSLVSMVRSGANTVTLNTRSTDPTLEVRRPYIVRQAGAGVTSFLAGSGATIQRESGKGLALAAQHAPATTMLVDDSTWWIFGALADA